MCGFVRVFRYRPYNQIDAESLAKLQSVAESDSSLPKMLFSLRLRSLTVL